MQMMQAVLYAYTVGPYLALFFRFPSSQDHTTARADLPADTDRDNLATIPDLTYRAVPRLRSALEAEVLSSLLSEYATNRPTPTSRTAYMDRVSSLQEAVTQRIANDLPEIDTATRSVIAFIVAHNAYVFGPLVPLILDEFVEDVFLDRPKFPVYFDHHLFGRVRTSIVVDEDTASRIETLLRLESNSHLDRHNPSLKTSFSIAGVPLRFSATIRPLSPDGLHLEIRRARLRPLTLLSLIRNGTMSTTVAALLLLAHASRMNITIVGEPGSGKTTLLNALDMCSPTRWRRIYIEDTIESRVQPGTHQLRFSVDSVDEVTTTLSKSDEIVKTLHRSPDYVILGEIQTREHSASLFASLMAGLRCIQTCHSSSAAALISRWQCDHGIDESAIALMDLIVVLSRPRPAQSWRIVSEVVEILRRYDNGRLHFAGTGTIYDLKSGLKPPSQWARYGAMNLMAQRWDVKSIEGPLLAVDRLLQQALSGRTSQSETFGDLLWKNGHPFRYGSQSDDGNVELP